MGERRKHRGLGEAKWKPGYVAAPTKASGQAGTPSMTTYRMLSIDGGGIRGIIPIKLMQRLSSVSDLEGWGHIVRRCQQRRGLFAGLSKPSQA